MELNPSSNKNQNENYLDDDLKIENKNIITKVYDKIEDFTTTSMVHFRSNVHISIFKNIYINGLISLNRLTSNIVTLKEEIISWFETALPQVYPIHFVRNIKFHVVGTCIKRSQLKPLFETDYWAILDGEREPVEGVQRFRISLYLFNLDLLLFSI